MVGRDVEARSWLWRSCTREFYEFRPFSEEVTTLRLGARRRSTGLYACVLQGVRTLVLVEGVAYIECARTPASPRYKEFNVHKVGVLQVTSAVK